VAEHCVLLHTRIEEHLVFSIEEHLVLSIEEHLGALRAPQYSMLLNTLLNTQCSSILSRPPLSMRLLCLRLFSLSISLSLAGARVLSLYVSMSLF